MNQVLPAYSFVFCLLLCGIASAGACPAGAGDCFLCGGVDGIPCTTDCQGAWSESAGAYVSCECPQGEPCVCHCPYGGGEAVAGVGEGGLSGSAFGNLTRFTGEVYYRMPGGGWARVAGRIPISEGAAIKTMKGSEAVFVLNDGSKIYLDPSTEIEMTELVIPAGKSTLDVVIELVKGAIFSDVTKRDGTKFDVNCQVSVPGVKGTKFAVYYDDAAQEATVKAVEGTVTVPDRFGRSMDLGAGRMVRVSGSSGLGESESFDAETEERRWGVQSGECASALILALVLAAPLALRRA